MRLEGLLTVGRASGGATRMDAGGYAAVAIGDGGLVHMGRCGQLERASEAIVGTSETRQGAQGLVRTDGDAMTVDAGADATPEPALAGGGRHGAALILKGGAVSVSLAVTAVAYLFAYAILARDAGLAAIGLWGIIASFFQYGRVLDFGAGATVLNRAPPLVARGEFAAAAREVDGAFVLSGLAASVAAVTISLAMWAYCRTMLSPADYAANHIAAVLAINAVALVLMSQGSLLHAAIDAHNRAELRSLLVLAGSVVFAVLAIGLAKRFSILGIAIAQAAQWLFLWLSGRLLLHKLNPAVGLLPSFTGIDHMREIVGQGWRFQLAALIAAALDPLAKAMAAGFGGLGFAGQFEVLIRIVAGGRTIFANGFQVLAPATARLDAADLRGVMVGSLVLAARLMLLFGIVFAATSPLVMRSVTAQPGVDLGLVFLFVAAWAINLLSGPGYFSSIGLALGHLNLRSHLAMLVVLVVGGPLLGYIGGGIGVVFAYSAAIVVGSLYLVLAVNRRLGIGVAEIVGGVGTGPMLVALAATLTAGWIATRTAPIEVISLGGAIGAMAGMVLFAPYGRELLAIVRRRSARSDVQ